MNDPNAAQNLRLELVRETYRQRGGNAGFNEDWAFHQCAVQHDLGAPIGPSAPGSQLITAGDHSYGYQPFARDTVVSESSQWYVVESLNGLLNGRIPADGVEFEILKANYATSDGGRLHPDWAFHQFAVREQLGPPLVKSSTIPVAGQNYDIQVFACDTLCSPVGQPANIRRLSQISPDDPLYAALWGETYKPCGQAYQADSPFQKVAANAHLGAPLSGVHPATLAGATYQVQVFALDTLYAGADNVVQRMSALPTLVFENTPPELRSTFNFSTDTPPARPTIMPAQPAPPPIQVTNLAQVVQLALAQVGKPYVWGATGPSTFDCSGLVLWCYGQVGVHNLVHKASMQYTQLKQVDRSQIQPGDLIYFQNIQGENGICHVGMYVGDIQSNGKGAMVHAATPQLGVLLEPDVFGSTFWRKYIAGFRRV